MELLTTNEAAAFLRLHPVTLRNMARLGQITAYRTGRHWKFDRAVLILYMRQSTS